MLSRLVLVASILSLYSPLLQGAESTWQRENDCDIPGHNIGGEILANVDECQSACAKKSGCKAYTFITGWKRCNYKSAGKKRFQVKMHAAKITDESGKRTAATPKVLHDHKGKDMESKPRVQKDAATCATACIEEVSCKGYVFIEGYDACWLKKTDGALREKRFICGYKQQPEAKNP